MNTGNVTTTKKNDEEVFVVQLEIGNDWENIFKDDEGKEFFATEALAKAALDEFIAETQEEYEAGNLDEAYDIEDFRIIPKSTLAPSLKRHNPRQ